MKLLKNLLLSALMLWGGVCATYAQEKTTTAGVPVVKLNNGVEMPRFGIGTFLQPSDEVCEQSCLTALKAGYRHIDTAHAYQDEAGVGRAVKESGIPREEIWITSKLWPTEYGEGKTLKAIDEMLDRMQLDYIDLLYVHQPVGDFVGAWKDMEKAVKMGKVRALGISNFDANDEVWNTIMQAATIKPQVLQMECHPYAQRVEMRKKAAAEGIQVECWFPLGGAMSNGALFKDPVIKKIAEAHGKTPAQVILRWHIQEGFSVIPGASNPDYIKENIQIFDFQLTDDEMQQMRSLNKEKRFFNATLEDVEKMVWGARLVVPSLSYRFFVHHPAMPRMRHGIHGKGSFIGRGLFCFLSPRSSGDSTLAALSDRSSLDVGKCFPDKGGVWRKGFYIARYFRFSLFRLRHEKWCPAK